MEETSVPSKGFHKCFKLTCRTEAPSSICDELNIELHSFLVNPGWYFWVKPDNEVDESRKKPTTGNVTKEEHEKETTEKVWM